MSLPHTQALLRTIDTLRSPGGCPWDIKQTLPDAARYLIDEGGELLEAALAGDREHVTEELGDLLFMVAFCCRIHQETAPADFEAVARTGNEKLIRRHPHIFDVGDGTTEGIDSAAKVLTQWHEIKAAEKAARAARDGEAPRTLAGVARGQPALARAQQLGGNIAVCGRRCACDRQAERLRVAF